jgi:hypothetical protein
MVGAVAGGLDDDSSLETEEHLARGHLLARGVDRREGPVDGIGESASGPEDVAVGIGAAGREA